MQILNQISGADKKMEKESRAAGRSNFQEKFHPSQTMNTHEPPAFKRNQSVHFIFSLFYDYPIGKVVYYFVGSIERNVVKHPSLCTTPVVLSG